MSGAPPKKNAFTLTEIVLLSIVWSSASFVWQNVLKQGLGNVYSHLGLGQYATDILTALTLLACVYAMVLLFANVQLGRSSVFQLVDTAPPLRLPLPLPLPADGSAAPPEAMPLPPPADGSAAPLEGMPLA